MAELDNARQVTVTVTQAAPLLVIADGADTPVPAVVTDGASYAAGDRVQVTVRTPNRPLVTGKVDTA